MSGAIPKRRRATACSYHKNSCRSQNCDAICSFSARSMRWAVRPFMPRISIRANRRRGCLRTVARPVIAARPVSPKGAPVLSYSSSCRSITRPVRTRPRNWLLIWPRSTPDEAADRGRRGQSRRVPRHPDRPNRRRPRHSVEIVEKLSLAAAYQQRRITQVCEATMAAFRLGTTTRRVNSPLL
jgi:hypothetical protein